MKMLKVKEMQEEVKKLGRNDPRTMLEIIERFPEGNLRDGLIRAFYKNNPQELKSK